MIPKISQNADYTFKFKEKPSRTYHLDFENQRIVGYVNDLEAMKQAIYLMLSVERYEQLIYSWNYGIELEDLYGKETSFVIPELKRRISEALLHDSRIKSVSGFDFETQRGKIAVTFTVSTIYGETQIEKVVNI